MYTFTAIIGCIGVTWFMLALLLYIGWCDTQDGE